MFAVGGGSSYGDSGARVCVCMGVLYECDSPPTPTPTVLVCMYSQCMYVLMLAFGFPAEFLFYSCANVLVCSASFGWTSEAPYMDRFFMHSLIYLNDLYTDW